jgi:ubiquinone/menaquinone biosynthesis C-methylase UbiE
MSAAEEIRPRIKSNFDFRLMALTYRVRDYLLPRIEILKEVGIEEGFHVLDYGCGPSSYIRPLAKMVGRTGKIYALDIHPLAVQAVQRLASKKGLANVQAILSDCQTGLSSNSVDVVLLYDILHDLDKPERVLAELHRVLKTDGILSVSDHHLKQDEIVSKTTGGGLFRPSRRGRRTYSFSKA